MPTPTRSARSGPGARRPQEIRMNRPISPAPSWRCSPRGAPVAAAPRVRGPCAPRLARSTATIIGYETVEGRGQVPVMAEYLAGLFREAGFADRDIEIIPNGETASLIVRYRGSNPSLKPMLLAHGRRRGQARGLEARSVRADRGRTVLLRPRDDGRQGGRCADLETFLRLRREGFVPERDVVIAFSGDEETGMHTRATSRAAGGAEFALNGDGGQGVLNNETGKPEVYYLQGAEKYYATFEFTRAMRAATAPAGRTTRSTGSRTRSRAPVQFPVMWNDWTMGGFREQAKVRRRALWARRWRASPPTRGTRLPQRRSPRARSTSARCAPPASRRCCAAATPTTRCRSRRPLP